MPTYTYKCPSCVSEFDVTKSIDDIDSLESCPLCGRNSIEGRCRIISEPRNFYGQKAENPFYSQALGKWVKGQRDESKQAKSRGWEELGTTDIDRHIDTVDRDREKKLASRWEPLLKG